MWYDERDGTRFMYWSCPVRFVPDNVWEFIRVYNYHEKFQSAKMPDYANVNPRFLAAAEYYEYAQGEAVKHG